MGEETAAPEETTTTAAEDVAGMVTTETPPGEEASFYLAEGVAGSGETPEWFKGDKYKSVSDQAMAYNELESKFGSFTGAPENYEVNLSDELKEKGLEINADDPLVEAVIKFATEKNMNQEGFDGLVELYGMSELAKKEAVALNRADEIKSLGDNGQARLDNLEKWAKTNLPEDLYTGFLSASANANAVRALEKLVSMTRPAAMSATDLTPAPGGITAEEVKAMQFEKDENGNRRIQTDPAFKQKYKEALESVYGTGDHRIIVGQK